MKCRLRQFHGFRNMSPSIRREWIEMTENTRTTTTGWSPSIRREWIEIPVRTLTAAFWVLSPSIRREWIEIVHMHNTQTYELVSLHTEGVD